MSRMDIVLRFMLDHGIPISREAYLEIAFMGDVHELDGEEAAEIPELILKLQPEPKPKQ